MSTGGKKHVLYHPVYNKKAARPATMAPALTKVTAAPPTKGDGTGFDPVTVPLPPVVPLELVVLFPLVRVKLAQVRRVVLLVWITMERLPKKLLGPW